MAILNTGHPLPALFVPGGPFYNWPYTRRNIQTAETYVSERLRKQNGTNLPNGSGAPASGPRPSPSPAHILSPVLGSDLALPQSQFVDPSFGQASSPPPAPAPSSSFGDIELPRAHHSSSTHEPVHELDICASTLQEMNYDISLDMAPYISDDHTVITADDLDFSNMESELNADTINRITDGRWLNDAAIAKLLELFSSLRPLDAKSIDPLLIDRAPVNKAVTHLLSASGSDLTVLVPIRCNAHWILVVLRATDKSVLYYNSMPGHDMPNLPARIIQVCQGLINVLDYDIGAAVSAGTLSCPRQLNTVDCGVAVIVNGLYTLASRPLPSTTSCDYGIWRLVLAAMLIDADELGGNLSLVPPELAEEPIIDVGTAEPRPAHLAASEYRDWVRTEKQRLVTHMRSTVDSLAELLSRCRSYRMLITEIVAVLESPALNPDTAMNQELEKLTTSLENVRSLRWVNPIAESALKKQLRILQTRADHGAACRARMEVLIGQYKADLEDLEVMNRDTAVLVEGLEQDLAESGNSIE
nr:hypothetical protein FVER53263_14024 [Fusarium verticillioides]